MIASSLEKLGRGTVSALEEVGYGFALLVESIYWIFMGPSLKQPVRLATVFHEMKKIGIQAIPIVAVLAFTNGAMLAIQGIFTLEEFGAESEIVPGIAMSVTREFAVLIVGIVIAGRSGSSIAARIGAMQMSQEIDALEVMGVDPVRYIVAPIIIAMLVMFPMLTILADILGLLGGGILSSLELGMNIMTFGTRCMESIAPSDIFQGLSKSIVFAVLISLVAVINGFSVEGGAEGLGEKTTRSVVLSISSIIVADMIFTFFLSR